MRQFQCLYMAFSRNVLLIEFPTTRSTSVVATYPNRWNKYSPFLPFPSHVDRLRRVMLQRADVALS